MGELPKDMLLVGTAEGIFSFVRRNGSWRPQKTLLPGEHISALLFECRSQTLFAGTTDGEVFCSADEGDSWQRIIQGIGPVSKAHHHQNLQASAA